MKDLLKIMLKAQNVNKYIYVFFLFIIVSCSSNKVLISNNHIEVLNTILSSSRNKIFYKTIINDVNSLKKPINEYIKDNLQFQFCQSNIISEGEICFLRKKMKNLQTKSLLKLPLDYKNKLTKKKKEIEISFISIPILFRNNTMALYYNTQRYGGSFTLLQKKDSKWEIICSSSVWIE
jgi:hypothetical protein